jgi:hypothetical protein
MSERHKMNMDHNDWLKEQTNRSPEKSWEIEDVMMNNQALRLHNQFLKIENEKQRERILKLEEQIRSMDKTTNIVNDLHRDWQMGHGWGKGKDE